MALVLEIKWCVNLHQMPNSCHTYYQETYILRIYSDEASFERRREDFIWLQIVQWLRRREIAVLILPQPHHSETSTSAGSPNMQQTALNYNLVFRHETNYLAFNSRKPDLKQQIVRVEMKWGYPFVGVEGAPSPRAAGDVFDKHPIVMFLVMVMFLTNIWSCNKRLIHSLDGACENTNTDKKTQNWVVRLK